MTDAAIAAQVRAATPSASSWVSANAGTGKTRVLTDRVARLLLAGTEPQKILCLTYTKAAAAEMQNRLFRTLGAWAMLPDDDLAAALARARRAGAAAPPDLARARTLFARALETPGGLRIQTIHAFCEALLRRFPLEAGVAPQFGVLEDRQARALREEVLDALAAAAPRRLRRPRPPAPRRRPRPAPGRDRPAPRRLRRRPSTRPASPRALGARPEITPADLAARVLTARGRGPAPRPGPLLAACVQQRRQGRRHASPPRSPPPTRTPASTRSRCVLLSGPAPNAFTAKTGQFPTRPFRDPAPGADARPRRADARASRPPAPSASPTPPSPAPPTSTASPASGSTRSTAARPPPASSTSTT